MDPQHQKSIRSHISSSNLLFKFLYKYRGLLSIEPKILVKENYNLSLVYTPGVGKCCKEIQQEPSRINRLTNRANSLLIISDGSGFPGNSDSNYHVLPYIETLCVFYKVILNIDAYPILIDPKLTADIEDLYQTLYNLSPAYAGLELYGFSAERLQKLETKIQARGNLKPFIFTSLQRDFLKSRLIKFLKMSTMLADLTIGCLLRALLDFGVSQPVANVCVQLYLERLSKDRTILKTSNLFDFARTCVENAAISILQDQPGRSKASLNLTEVDVRAKLDAFYREGSEGWVEYSEHNYLDKSNDLNSNAIELHRAHRGTITTASRAQIHDLWLFSLLLREKDIKEVSTLLLKEQQLVYELTCKSNYCAIITNGTSVLGFGDIGTEAGLPVMEGKSCLFKELGGVDIVPICIKEKDPQKVIQIIKTFGHSFAAINLEDIKAPECFEIEEALIKALDIPVFHDDQHGTAIVVLAALINSLKVVKKEPQGIKVVLNGAGAAGHSILDLLMGHGVSNVIVCDTTGAIYKGRKENMNKYKQKMAEVSNPKEEKGKLQDVIKQADVFIGVSQPKVITKEMIKSMKEKPIIFALANPVPEIMPDEAKEAGAYVIATGRSDFPNQVNNSLAFPGVFRGALSIRAKEITKKMKQAAAVGLAKLVSEEELTRYHIIPNALDRKVPEAVAKYVAETGIEEGVARVAKRIESLKRPDETPKL